MPIQRPVARPAKPLAPALARPNIIVNKPAPAKPRAQATSWAPPEVAGAGGMNRPYLGAPMLPNALPTGRIPGTYPRIAASPPPPIVAPVPVRPKFNPVQWLMDSWAKAARNWGSGNPGGATGGDVQRGLEEIRRRGF